MGRVIPPPAPGQPPAAPAGRDPRRPWAPSPFMRLARTHAASVSGDALFAIGLAGSVFFSLDFNSARWRVALYLVLTIAPFAVAAPLIGPAIDRVRGGRRWIIVGSMGARLVLSVLVVRHMQSLLFYPEAFGMLVLQKVYSISKSAVVPGTVRSDEELVEANSKLTVLSALAVVVAVVPGGILLKLGGGGWSVALGAVVFGVGTVLALQLPPTTVAAEPAGEAEKEELRSAGIVLASSAMAVIRGIVGFLAFMLAFDIKQNGALWELGIVAGAAQLGFFLGAVAAPRVRKLATEEHILVGALAISCVTGLATAALGGLVGAAVLSMTIGATGSAAKQAFDAIVQRDAPDANRGRSFARFETRFQLWWVLGALVPIVVPIPADVGFALIALASAVAIASYLLGQRRIRRGQVPPKRPSLTSRLRRHRPPSVDETPAPADAGSGAGPARPATTAHRAPIGPSDPTVVVDDPTVVAADATVAAPPGPATPPPAPAATPPPPPDPARRWMPTGAPTAAPAPPTPTPTSTPTPAPPPPPSARPGEPAHRRHGLLFDPEAWDDAPPPPPGPPEG